MNSLVVNGVKVKLDSKLIYKVTLDKEDKAKIEAKATKDTSSVKISDIDKITNGTIVSITVTAEDGNTSTYLVSCVMKEKIIYWLL